MPTTVVNLKHKPWPADFVYVGRRSSFSPRGVPGEDGRFGNPHAVLVGRRCPVCRNATGLSPLECFRLYFLRRVEEDAAFRTEVLALKNATLACWCVPQPMTGADHYPCHAVVLARWLDAQEEP